MVIKVSEAAKQQIEVAANETGAENLPLRIATVRTPDGGLDYRMGFDDAGIAGGDSQDEAGNVTIVVAADEQAILDGTELDYVEIEPGQYHFIFKNPNDPSHARPGKKR